MLREMALMGKKAAIVDYAIDYVRMHSVRK